MIPGTHKKCTGTPVYFLVTAAPLRSARRRDLYKLTILGWKCMKIGHKKVTKSYIDSGLTMKYNALFGRKFRLTCVLYYAFYIVVVRVRVVGPPGPRRTEKCYEKARPFI